MSVDAPYWARTDWPILRIKKYRLRMESVFFIKGLIDYFLIDPVK